jgi:hypothetical protein
MISKAGSLNAIGSSLKYWSLIQLYIMQKISLVILSASLLFFSCKKETSVISPSNDLKETTLSNRTMGSIESFQTAFKAQADTTKHLKGWFGDAVAAVSKAVVVVGADIGGAGGGVAAAGEVIAVAGIATGGTGAAVVTAVAAAGGAAVASAGAYDVVNKKSSGASTNNLGFDQVTFPTAGIVSNTYYMAGVMHNSYLSNIMTTNVSFDTWSSKFASGSDGTNTNAVFNNLKFQNYVNFSVDISKTYATTKDYKYLVNSYKSAGYYSSNVAYIAEHYLASFMEVTTPDQLQRLTNFYVDLVNTSGEEISIKDKEVLIAMFSTGVYSMQYWTK